MTRLPLRFGADAPVVAAYQEAVDSLVDISRTVGLVADMGDRADLKEGWDRLETAGKRLTAADAERLDVGEVARRYLIHAERQGRKPSTRQNIESEVRVHLSPFFGTRSIDAIGYQDVLDLVTVLERKGLAPKSIRKVVGTLSALFNFARAPRRRWATANPCEGLDLPAVPDATEIRFLTLDEVDLPVGHARPGVFCPIDRAIFRTAAMTVLRKGELVALRWCDVWPSSRIRVRQNYVGASSARRSPGVRLGVCRWPMKSPANSSGSFRGRTGRLTTISCSRIPPPARRCTRRA